MRFLYYAFKALICSPYTAPLLWLHSEDLFRPSDLLSHVHHTTPQIAMEPVDGIRDLDLDNLAILNQKSTKNAPVALTATDDITKWPSWLNGKTPMGSSGELQNDTACVVILVESEQDSRDTDAFYFYFYSYNRGANITMVLQPLRGLLEGKLEDNMHFGDHVGDW